VSDKFKIDSHKLSQHPQRVADWLSGHDNWETAKSIYPIYVEISPVGACNHRCTFCSVDYIGYQTRYLPYETLLTRLGEMSGLGIKSIMFAGEGEPTLYKKLPEVLDYCSEVGIDTSLTTNMVPFTSKNVDSFVRNCKWIKTSINAGTPDTYASVHQTKSSEFDRVLDNFKMSVEVRNREGYDCTIGGQILLLPENASEVIGLAERLREIGVDYLVVKPYTQSLYGVSRIYSGLRYGDYHSLGESLEKLQTDNFKVVYRRNTMNKLDEASRSYTVCNATPFFWAYIMANGDLYACSAYLQDDRFKVGNVMEHGFQELWEGEVREKIYNFVKNDLDITECRVNCRMDSVNRYLWSLLHPDSHVNFI